MKTFLRFSILSLTSLASFPIERLEAKGPKPENLQLRPAIFKVTTDVVNPDVQAFTVTGDAFGNTLQRTGKGGFEPATFRTQFKASRDSENRIYARDNGGGINYYDVYQSGYLDGAEVRIYRLVDGKIKLVRRDTIAQGGTVIEEWEVNTKKLVSPDKETTQFRWEDWNRQDATRWFTIFAVDESGNLSGAPSPLAFSYQQATKDSKVISHQKKFQKKKTSDSSPPATPTNFKGAYNSQGVIAFSWDKVSNDDLAGYLLSWSDTDPSTHRGTYLQLAGKADSPEKAIKNGDMIIVNKSLVDFSSDWLSNRVGNLDRQKREFNPDGVPNGFDPDEVTGKTWRLVKYSEDTPVPNPGEYYFEMTLREGDTQLVGKSGIPDISTTSQDFYPVPENGTEYVMNVWMKADRPDAPPVIFTWDGDEDVGGFVGTHELQLSTEWEKYEVRFTGKNTDRGHHAYFVLKASGPATYSFDNYRVYAADAEYLDYREYQYKNLKRSGMAAFRTHGPIKTKNSTYSMRQYLGAAGETEGVAKGNTLGQSLRMMEQAGILPWLQIEMHMSPEEWLGFMEYMAAPFNPATDTKESKPWAYLRFEQGHPAPWIDSFETIYFELSNETWNGLFRPWIFYSMTDSATDEKISAGGVYAKYHDYVVDILRSSPYWQPNYEDTFIHVLGGWATSLNSDSTTRGYTQEIAQMTEYGEYITIAAYNGGWDEGEGPSEENLSSYFNVLNQVNQTAIPRIIRLNEVTQIASDRLGREVKFGTYEAGPGYALNGLNKAKVSEEQKRSQEKVMKSKLAGTATLDSFLARTYRGSDLDNFFTFAEGDLWKSHAKKYRGGMPHASFIPLEIFNNLATGDMLKVETKSVTTVDTIKFKRRQAIKNAPLASVYATRSGNEVRVFCISRRIANYLDPNDDGYTPFGVELPFNKAESITLYRLTGEPTDTNINEKNVDVQTFEIDTANLRLNGQFVISPDTGGAPGGLPPAEMYLYIFKGTNVGPTGKILSPKEVATLPTTFKNENH